MAVINGTLGDDFIVGTPEADLVNALTGNDVVYSLEGPDTVFGNQGNDYILGNQGRDVVFAGKGNDIAYGGKGNDTLYGNQGNDVLFGNEGNEVIFGNQENDFVYGGKGNDIIYGGKGNDVLAGDSGADTLAGGQGRDIFVLGRRPNNAAPFLTTGGTQLTDADCILDFTDGQDLIGLEPGLSFEQLNIFQGTGQNVNDTIIQDTVTGEFLAILKGVNRVLINAADFTSNLNPLSPLTPTPPTPTPTPPTPTPTPPTPTPTPTPTRPPTPPTPTPTPLADLTVTKSDSPDPVTVGQQLTYTLTVTNQGTASASSIVVRDTLPTGFTLTQPIGSQAGFTGTQAGQVVTFTGGSLAPGASATLTLIGTAPNTAGTITNTAVVDPDNLISESNEANNTVTITTTVSTAAPAGADDFVVVRAGETATIPVLDNDTGATTVTGVTQPPIGTAAVAAGGEAITYVNPNPTPANTPETFTYTNDAGQTPTVQVTVVAPDAPLVGTGAPELLIGSNTPSFDPATGTTNPELIQGGGGNDTVIGGLGADILTGGAGADEFRYNALADSGADPANTLEPGDTIVDYNPLEGDTIRLNFEVALGRPVAAGDVVLFDTLLSNGRASIGLNVLNTPTDFLPEQFVILLNLAPTGTNYTAQDITNSLRFGAP